MPPKFFRISRGYAGSDATNTLRNAEPALRFLTGDVISQPYVRDELTPIREATCIPVMPATFFEMYWDQKLNPAPIHIFFVAARRVPDIEKYSLIIQVKYEDFDAPVEYECDFSKARVDGEVCLLSFIFCYGQMPEEASEIEDFLLESDIQIVDVSDGTSAGYPAEVKLLPKDATGKDLTAATLPLLDLMPEIELNENDMRLSDL